MNKLKEIIKGLKKKARKISDKRSGKHQDYSIEDIVMSAFAPFVMQSPSWLNFQRNMQKRKDKNNAYSLFEIKKIPTDNHIRQVLDGVDNKEIESFYNYIYSYILKKDKRVLKEYKFLNNSILILLDGTYYHSSSKIHLVNHLSKPKRLGWKDWEITST